MPKKRSIREKAKERLERSRIAKKQGLFVTKDGFTSAKKIKSPGIIRTALGLGRKKPTGTRKTRGSLSEQLISSGETPAEKKARLKKEK